MSWCTCDPTGFLEPIDDEKLKARIAALEQTVRGLPAAPESEGEYGANLSKSTQRSEVAHAER